MESLGSQMTVKLWASQTLYSIFSSVAAALPDPSVVLCLTGKTHVSRVHNAYYLLIVSFRVDLYIEGASSSGYAAFVNEIRSRAVGASKQ